jgi:hypothetical protein
MKPVIDELKKHKDNIYKIDLGKDRHMGKIFGVMGTPATVIVGNSQIEQFILGARSKKFLTNLTI